MNCLEFKKVADALADGELGRVERTRASVHATGCPACRKRVEAIRKAKAKVKEKVKVPHAPVGLSSRVKTLLEGAQPAERATDLSRVVRKR